MKFRSMCMAFVNDVAAVGIAGILQGIGAMGGR